MTASEMHISFKFGLDKLDSNNYPNFEDEEVDLLLNQAQDRYVKQRMGNNNAKRQSFEESEKRTDDLKNVLVNAILTPAANTTENKPNGVFVTLPDTYWFAMNEDCAISYSDCHGATVSRISKIRAIQHDDYNNIIEDPFNKPWKNEIVRLMENGKVELISESGQTITTYYLRYIKRPNRISITTPTNCELSEHTHQEIVDMAIQIALEGIEAKRQNTFDKIVNTNE